MGPSLTVAALLCTLFCRCSAFLCHFLNTIHKIRLIFSNWCISKHCNHFLFGNTSGPTSMPCLIINIGGAISYGTSLHSRFSNSKRNLTKVICSSCGWSDNCCLEFSSLLLADWALHGAECCSFFVSATTWTDVLCCTGCGKVDCYRSCKPVMPDAAGNSVVEPKLQWVHPNSNWYFSCMLQRMWHSWFNLLVESYCKGFIPAATRNYVACFTVLGPFFCCLLI